MEYLCAVNFAPFARRGLLGTDTARAELQRMRRLTEANAVILCPCAVQDGPFCH